VDCECKPIKDEEECIAREGNKWDATDKKIKCLKAKVCPAKLCPDESPMTPDNDCDCKCSEGLFYDPKE